MAAASFVRDNFLGGEYSKVSQGRITSKEYPSAMDTCLNGLPIEGGAWTRRPGTQNGGHTRGGTAGKLVPFILQETAPYQMEFTDGFVRWFNGPSLVKSNDPQVVVSISTANPAKVATTSPHGWLTGNTVMFSLLGTTAPLLQNRQFVITKTSATEFTLVSSITGTSIDGSTLGAIAAGAVVSRVMELPTPYGNNLWNDIRSVQAESKALLLSSIAPYIIDSVLDPAGTQSAEFEVNPAVLKDGPYLDPVGGGALMGPSAVTGSVSLTLKFPAYLSTKIYSKGDFAVSSSVNYQSLVDQNLNNTPASSPTFWVAVNAGVAVGPDGFVGTDVGRMIRLFSEPPLYSPNTGSDYTAGQVVAFNGTYWTALTSLTGSTPSAGSINPDQPGNKLTTWAVNSAAAIWTWGKITGFSTMISQTVSGVSNIGRMTNNGGLAGAFDGITVQSFSACAAFNQGGGGVIPTDANVYLGRDFGGGAQKIASVSVFPSADFGFAYRIDNFTINLRAKASLPADATDGTLLGSSGVIVANSFTPIAIVSNDTATSWNYVWIEIVGDATGLGFVSGWNLYVSELQYFNPTTSSTGTGVTIELLGDDLKYTSDIRVWRLGVYSDTTGWPRCGTYHEGRIVLGGVIGNRFDASVSNGVDGASINMAPTAPSGAIADNNAFSYIFNAKDVNTIFWMESEQQGILCGTQAGEWLVQATTANAILTPTNIQAHRITKIGCANIEPQHAELTLLFVQRFKHKLMEYFADVFSGRFSSPNLSLNANHLSTRGLEEIAYQQTLTPVLWVRTADGNLIGMTYKRDSLMSSQGPDFFGWHQHTLGSGRTVESLRIGPSAAGFQTEQGVLDTLTMITNDAVSGIRHVEFLTNLFEENTPATSAWFLDDAVVPSSYIEATVAGVLGLSLYGLWHLNGKTVTVFANGVDQGDFAVASGTCFIPYTSTLTAAIVTAAAGALPLVVGFTYTSRGRIVRPASQQETGARQGPGFGKPRRIHEFAALLQDTFGISFGTVFGKLKPARLRTTGDTPIAAGSLFSGIYWDPLTDDYSMDGMIAWEISRPYPATVSCLTGMLHTMDK